MDRPRWWATLHMTWTDQGGGPRFTVAVTWTYQGGGPRFTVAVALKPTNISLKQGNGTSNKDD